MLLGFSALAGVVANRSVFTSGFYGRRMTVLEAPGPLLGTGKKCGTRSGYLEHYMQGQAACEACRLSNATYRRDLRARNKQKNAGKSLQGAKCGTVQGYDQHISKGTSTCEPCRKARAEYQAAYRSKSGRDLAKDREYTRARYRREMATPEGRDKLSLKWKLRDRRRRLQVVPGAPVTPVGLRGRYAMFGWHCWICRCELSPETVTMDHVKPVSAGGLHVLANLRPACHSCNSRKGATWGGVGSFG